MMKRWFVVTMICWISGWCVPALALDSNVTCLLRPRHVVQLGSPLNGILSSVDVDRGDQVTKGQILAHLESSMEEATLKLDKARAADTSDIDELQTQTAMLNRKAQRTRQLAARNIASSVALDEAQSDYETSKIKVKAAQIRLATVGLEMQRSAAALDLKRIKSPIDGVIIERKLEPGDYVSEQSAILAIAEIDLLNAEVIVPGSLYGSIKVGATAQVFPAAPIGGSYPATVEVVDPVIDAASDTFAVRLLVKNPRNEVPAGLRCDVRWSR